MHRPPRPAERRETCSADRCARGEVCHPVTVAVTVGAPRSGTTAAWTRPARWTVGAAALAAAVWLLAYSFPAPSLFARLFAAAVSVVVVVLALGWAVSARTRRVPVDAERESAVRGGRAVRAPGVLVAVAVLTFALCAVRAPMWVRLAEAVPQMVRLAHRAQSATVSGSLAPAWAGTYHFSDVHRSPAGYVEFDTNVSGLLQSASYMYSPGQDPRTRDAQAGFTALYGVRYRHLLGPWWAATSDVPGA